MKTIIISVVKHHYHTRETISVYISVYYITSVAVTLYALWFLSKMPRKAPTQKPKPSDDNSNNSSKAEKTLASATEKNPVKAKTPVKEKKTKSTEKKGPY